MCIFNAGLKTYPEYQLVEKSKTVPQIIGLEDWKCRGFMPSD